MTGVTKKRDRLGFDSGIVDEEKSLLRHIFEHLRSKDARVLWSWHGVDGINLDFTARVQASKQTSQQVEPVRNHRAAKVVKSYSEEL